MRTSHGHAILTTVWIETIPIKKTFLSPSTTFSIVRACNPSNNQLPASLFISFTMYYRLIAPYAAVGLLFDSATLQVARQFETPPNPRYVVVLTINAANSLQDTQSICLRVCQPASGRMIIDIKGHPFLAIKVRFPSFEPATHQINRCAHLYLSISLCNTG